MSEARPHHRRLASPALTKQAKQRGGKELPLALLALSGLSRRASLIGNLSLSHAARRFYQPPRQVKGMPYWGITKIGQRALTQICDRAPCKPTQRHSRPIAPP
jgi:hypothetical protein